MGIVYGVGINDSNYVTQVKGVDGKLNSCPFYSRWRDMLKRCYSEKYHKSRPSYVGCSVCDEWLYFMTFRKWMIEQDWEGMALDKDFLVQGNKVYSPDTCVFMPQQLNSLLVDCSAARGELPLGVSWHKGANKYRAQIKVGGRTVGLLLTGNASVAHAAWQKAKIEVLKSEIGKHNDLRIDAGLQLRVDQLQYGIDNNLITERL